MDYASLIAGLSRRGQFRINPGLDRTRAILKTLGNPHASLSSIHIAGTNGKGSVAACLESVLRQAGYRTGLYTSPHLNDVRERIQIDRQPISESKFMSIAQAVLQAEQRAGFALTYFEFLTVMAFKALADHSVDIALIETGMGGRWDATNVMDHPLLTVITSIGLDHTQWLGRTKTAIAREKAGIIKQGVPLVSGVRGAGAKVIAAVALAQGAPLCQIDKDYQARGLAVNWEASRQTLAYSSRAGSRSITVGLLGNYQVDNAAISLAGLETLQKKGWGIDDTALQEGMSDVTWPGRFQLLADRTPPVLFDGAHNPPAMKCFLETLTRSPWWQIPKTFVFGAYRDKEVRLLLAMLRPQAARLLLCTLPGRRALSARKAAKLLEKREDGVQIVSDPYQALRKAIQSTEPKGLVVVTGSLALVGMLLKSFQVPREAPCLI